MRSRASPTDATGLCRSLNNRYPATRQSVDRGGWYAVLRKSGTLCPHRHSGLIFAQKCMIRERVAAGAEIVRVIGESDEFGPLWYRAGDATRNLILDAFAAREQNTSARGD